MWKLSFGNIESQQRKLLSAWISGQKYLFFLNNTHVGCPTEVHKILVALLKNRVNGLQ